jgi:hypothetical protein
LGRDAPALSKVGAGTFQEESPVAESGARRIARRYVDGRVVASLLTEVQFLTGIFLLAGLTWFNVFGKAAPLYMAGLAFTAYGALLFFGVPVTSPYC